MPENRDSRLEAGQTLELCAEGVPDASEPLEAERVEPREDRLSGRRLAALRDDGVDAVLLDRPAHARVAVAVHVRIAARRAENRAAAAEDAADVVPVERANVPFHEPVPAVADPDHLEPVRDDRAADDSTNDGV